MIGNNNDEDVAFLDQETNQEKQNRGDEAGDNEGDEEKVSLTEETDKADEVKKEKDPTVDYGCCKCLDARQKYVLCQFMFVIVFAIFLVVGNHFSHVHDSIEAYEAEMKVWTEVSGEAALKNENTPQYKAASWMAFDDALELKASSPGFIQRYVVAVLYFSTGGDSWARCYSNDKTCSNATGTQPYLSDSQECVWYGSTCNEENQIEKIVLSNNSLYGAIPSELRELSLLREFQLDHNRLYGTIPEDIFQKNLQNIDLSTNSLAGTLSSKLGLLTSLVSLYLGENKIAGTIPSEINEMTNLAVISIQRNQFSGTLPANLTRLTKVTQFFVSENNFTGPIPSAIPQMYGLELADFYVNSFTGTIPASIGNLEELQRLQLAGNLLTGTIPATLGNARSLWYLTLQYNMFNGTMPESICDLKLDALFADCKIPPPNEHYVNCSCCTLCCDQNGCSTPSQSI